MFPSRRIRLRSIALAIVLSLPVAVASAQVDQSLWICDRQTNVIVEHDLEILLPGTWFLHTIEVTGFVVTGVRGIAWDPSSELFFLLLVFESAPDTTFLATWDPGPDVVEVLGDTGGVFDCLALDEMSIPHAVSPWSASPGAAFVSIDPVTATTTQICSMITPGENRLLAFDASTQEFVHARNLLLERLQGHFSGVCTVDVTVVDSAPIAFAFCWSTDHDAFLWQGHIGLYSVDAVTGTSEWLGPPAPGTVSSSWTDMSVGPQVFQVDPPVVVRGDSNDDGIVDVADVVHTLAVLFSGTIPLECFSASDSNGDDQLNIGDPVATLVWLFVPSSPPPPDPGPYACGAVPVPMPIWVPTSCPSYESCP